jgi:hypothetical protein
MTEYNLLVAVEDELSAAVMCKLIQATGRNFVISRIMNARGYGRLKADMSKFRTACHVLPHVVLTDLDQYPCPPALLRDWKAQSLPPQLLIRVAVREVEAWLLADRNGIANFLSVAKNKVPQYPEAEADPKRTLINLARKSRRQRLAMELVPETGSSASIGPLYNARLSEFVTNSWDVECARMASPSLDRTLSRLASFMFAP